MTAEETQKLRNVKGYIHFTESFGAVDGPGIRFVFFMQGCPLRCLYCHNPDSVSFSGGEFVTAGQAADEAMRYANFIKSGGVTFSGGEPLAQAKFVHAVTTLLAEHKVRVAIDTSGGVGLNVPFVMDAIDAAELVMLDIKAADDESALELTGQNLANALAMLDYCEQTKKAVWIRHVLVDGYTLRDDKLERLAEILAPYKCVELVDLLPFHKLGEPKWQNAGLDYKLYDTPATTAEQLSRAKDILRRHNLKV